MIAKTYLEAKHKLETADFSNNSEFMEQYKKMEKEVMDKVNLQIALDKLKESDPTSEEIARMTSEL